MTDTAIIRRVLTELRHDSSTEDAPDSRRDAEAAIAELDRNAATVKQLVDAVRYVLARGRVNADLGYVFGPHTRAFEQLVSAYALATGEPEEEVRRWAAEDARPPHDRRPPEVEVLRGRVERLAMRLAAHGEEVDDA